MGRLTDQFNMTLTVLTGDHLHGMEYQNLDSKVKVRKIFPTCYLPNLLREW